MKNSKRWLALVITAMLVIGILPVASLAIDSKQATEVIQGVCQFAGQVAEATQGSQTTDGKQLLLSAVQTILPQVNENTNLWNDGATVNAIGNVLNDGISTGVNNWLNDGLVGGEDSNVNDGLVWGNDNDHNDGIVIGAHNDFNDGVVIGCNNVGNDGIAIDICHFVPTFVEEVPATCAKAGMKAHYVCPKCGDLFIKDGSGKVFCYKTVTEEELIIPAGAHTWSAPTYTWSTDHKTCTATRKCTTCGLVETETVKAAIAEKDGTRTYTADFAADWAETQVYTEKISNPTVPSTGDDSNMVLYVAMAGVAAMMVGVLTVASKKKVH